METKALLHNTVLAAAAAEQVQVRREHPLVVLVAVAQLLASAARQ